MKLIVTVLLAVSFGCAGATKKPTQPQARAGEEARPDEEDGGCPVWGCGSNGTRSTGTVDDSAPRVESVTLSSGEP